jgi:hypothetical protein
MTGIEDSNREAVEPFKLGVLGGTFTVTDVILADGQTQEDALNLIHSTPADRWFVILADSEGTTQDVLALIDEDYEFRFVGLGTLDND